MKNKITPMKSGPEITDGEIQSYMDFNLLLTKNTLASLQRKQRMIIKSIVFGLTLVVVITSLWFLNSGNQQQENGMKDSQKKIIGPSSIKAVPPVPDSAQQKLSEEKISPDEKKYSPQKSPSNPALSTDTDKKAAEEKPAPEHNPSVYVQAEPVEGYPALYDYFNRELRYPKEAIADSVQGVVSVEFTINTQGEPENVSIGQSLGVRFDKEAIRLIENMPLWKPATYNQKPVKSRMSVPLTFQIKKLNAHE
jgi:TonB family protein